MKASRFIALLAAALVLIMAVPFTANAAAAKLIYTSAQSSSDGVLILDNGQVWYRAAGFEDDKDYIITVRHSSGDEVVLTADDGEKTYNVWHYFRQTSVSSTSPRFTSLSSGKHYLVCNGARIGSAYTSSVSGDLIWEHIGTALRYTMNGGHWYLRFDEESESPFSFTQDLNEAAEVNIYTTGVTLARCITAQPHAESYVTEGSGYPAPTFTVGTADIDIDIVRWYVDGVQQPCSSLSFTADVLSGRTAGVHRVNCLLEGHDENGVHYRECSEDAAFVIAKGVVPDSVLTFSDIHEEYSLIPDAVEAVMDQTGGYIPSLIICTGDLVNGPTARTDEMLGKYYPRIIAELGGLDTVFVSGNHDPGEAASAMSSAAGLGSAEKLPASGGIIFNGSSAAVSAKGTNSTAAKGVKVYGLNYEAAVSDETDVISYEKALGDIEAFLSSAATDYHGELLIISAHSGLHAIGMQPESVDRSGDNVREWYGSNSYNIDSSDELSALLDHYAEEYDMDILYLFGHDHSRGETEMFLTDGDTLISTDSYADKSFISLPLSFTYAHSGYLSSVIGCADSRFSFICRDGDKYSFDLISTTEGLVRHSEFASKYIPPETTAVSSSVTTANTTTTTSAAAHSGKGGSPATGDNMHPVILLFPFAGLVLSSFRRRRNG